MGYNPQKGRRIFVLVGYNPQERLRTVNLAGYNPLEGPRPFILAGYNPQKGPRTSPTHKETKHTSSNKTTLAPTFSKTAGTQALTPA